jgi:hypothetical protein
MNHPTRNLSDDWRAKWPEPEKLLGQTARHIRSRRFYRIAMVTNDDDSVELVYEENGKITTHVITLRALARNYNIVPADRL